MSFLTTTFTRAAADFHWHTCTNGALSLSAFRSCFSQLLTSSSSFTKDYPWLSNPVTIVLIGACYAATMVVARFLTRGQPLSFARGKTFSRIALTHNLILCIGSLLMNVHVIWAITHLIHITSLPSSSSSFLQGLQHTFCVPRSSPNGLPTEVSFSLYIFLLSKVYELLDTFILVLRGRPLSLLHVWHHGSVMVEVWAWLEYDFAIGLYGMLFNTGVHVVMYAYYAATTLGVRSKLKSLITMTQIVQFLTGFASLVPFVFLHFGLGEVEGGCRGVPAAGVSAGINGSYLILFVLFYRQTYTKKVKEEEQGGGKKKQ